MSEQCHTTVPAIDHYLVLADTPLGATLRIDPKPASTDETDTWTYFVTAALVWAGRAIDYFDKHHVRRSELREVARKLGTTSELHLSDEARARTRKAAK
jgi:hypothetical protein